MTWLEEAANGHKCGIVAQWHNRANNTVLMFRGMEQRRLWLWSCLQDNILWDQGWMSEFNYRLIFLICTNQYNTSTFLVTIHWWKEFSTYDKLAKSNILPKNLAVRYFCCYIWKYFWKYNYWEKRWLEIKTHILILILMWT